LLITIAIIIQIIPPIAIPRTAPLTIGLSNVLQVPEIQAPVVSFRRLLMVCSPV